MKEKIKPFGYVVLTQSKKMYYSGKGSIRKDFPDGTYKYCSVDKYDEKLDAAQVYSAAGTALRKAKAINGEAKVVGMDLIKKCRVLLQHKVVPLVY